MTLSEILRDSDYKQLQFSIFQIQEFEKIIMINVHYKGLKPIFEMLFVIGKVLNVDVRELLMSTKN